MPPNSVVDPLIDWYADSTSGDQNLPQGSSSMQPGGSTELAGELRLIKSNVRGLALDLQWSIWAGPAGYGDPPTYITATSFSLVGDQRLASGGPVQPGRRIRAFVSAGTVYGYIISDTFSGGITTVEVILDSGALDNGLTQVDFGALTFTRGAGLPVPFARVTNSAPQSIPDSTRTVVTFDTAVYTNAGTHIYNVAAPDRLSAPLTGTYVIGGCVVFPTNATGIRGLGIGLNGNIATGLIVATDLQAPPTFPSAISVTTAYYLTAGQYVSMGVLQESGGALSTVVDSLAPIFWMYYLIP